MLTCNTSSDSVLPKPDGLLSMAVRTSFDQHGGETGTGSIQHGREKSLYADIQAGDIQYDHFREGTDNTTS